MARETLATKIYITGDTFEQIIMEMEEYVLNLVQIHDKENPGYAREAWRGWLKRFQRRILTCFKKPTRAALVWV